MGILSQPGSDRPDSVLIFFSLVNNPQVVDTLSDITNGTHPRPGDTPEHYTFFNAFYPFVLLYIIAYLFQARPASLS